jgi:predicted AAA+ superfamily ATPase
LKAENPSNLFYPRGVAERIRIALKDTPVVLVNGPRQCGKTTLARTLLQADRSYFTLDDDTTLLSAKADPVGFIRQIDTAILDEVQRAPELLRAIKQAVDNDRRPGRFLLTGSANILALPTVSDSLAGRMEVVTLLPLAQSEIHRNQSNFVDIAFTGEVAIPRNPMVGNALIERVLTGGYPEMVDRADPRRRSAWAREYIRAIVERDVREIADVERLDQMPQLLRALAHHSGQLLNFTQLAGHVGLDDKTARRYIGLFEQLFLVRRIEPWFRNPLKRLVKTPKLLFLDSGLLAALVGLTIDRIARDRSLFGSLLETFVANEILRLATWSDVQPTHHHYRNKDQDEVDIVLEDETGNIVGLEVKAAATVTTADFKGLRKVAAATGGAFKAGWVLYDGDKVLPFGDGLAAVPLSCLWGD